MDLIAIPELGVESAGDNVTYRLPTRPLGMLRLVGLMPIGFSVVWFSFLGKIVVPQFRHLANHPQPFDYFICAFLHCFILAGCGPAGMGLLILFGRSRVRWRNGHLAVSEHVGPFGWPRRMPRQPIRKFVVIGGGGPADGGRTLPGPIGKLATLKAVFENGVSRTVVAGYPRPWLEAIARDLSVRAGLAQSTPPPPVEIYQGAAKALTADVMEKPAGSPVVLQRNAASIVMEVPPSGLWKGSLGLFGFAILWCLMISGFTAAFLFGGKFEPVMIPFFGLFWLVGLGMLAAAINQGRRRVTFTAGRSELTVVKSGPFGTKRRDFRRADIADVSVGVSNVEVNHRFVPELKVHLVAGKKAGFLMGRDPDELGWVATELRNALGMAAPAQSSLPGSMAGPFAGVGARQPATPLGKFIGFLVFAVLFGAIGWRFFAGFFGHANHPARPPATNSFLLNKPIVGDPALVFNTFNPSKSKSTNCWAVGRETHAEWFIPAMSGNLSEIQLAVEPEGGYPHPGKATLFLASDKKGFPGRTLESFSASADEATGLLTLESTKKPALQAGMKYWVCARSDGGWLWHFNDQNVIHNSAREFKRGKWASAGDYCHIGAFSIRVSTNQPPTPPVAENPESSDSTNLSR